MNKLRPIERAYISGFFDGEGCIDFEKHRAGHPRCRMSQATPDVIEKIHQMVGCGYVKVKPQQGLGKREGAMVWTLSIRSQPHIEEFIRAILPYSIVKRAKLKKGLRWLERRKTI